MYAVSDLMTQDVIAVEADEPLAQAQLLWSGHSWSWLPVVEEGRPVGMVARENALSALRRGESGLVVRDVMMPQQEQVRPGTPLRHAASLMLRRQVRALAVVDETGHLAGILTDEALLQFALDIVTDLDRLSDGLRIDASHEEARAG